VTAVSGKGEGKRESVLAGFSAGDQSGDSGAEMRFSGIPELFDEGVFFQGVLHDPPLDTLPTPVNQPHFPQTRFVGRTDVLLDDGGNVFRMKRVEID
jgi:hypothetical protein